MLRLPREYAQILRDLPDTAENAFYWRERRRAVRHGEPWRAASNAVVLLATVFGGSFFGLWGLLYLGAFDHGRIPDWLGGRDGGRATFAFVAAVHALLIATTARGMVNGILAGEARRGTLSQLLLTRIPAFEMMLQMVVFPCQQAMLVAVAGLPLYMVLIALGSVGPQEVFVLYLLFLLMAIATPSWRTSALSEQSPEEMDKILQSQSRAAGCAAFAGTFLLIPGSVVIGSFVYLLHLIHPHVATRIPADVWPTFLAMPLLFMWIVVRLLTAPYTWFGLPVPPWVWIVAVLLLNRLSTLWYTSFYLRVAHPAQIAALPEMKALVAWRSRVRTLAIVGLTGYLWQPALESVFAGRAVVVLWAAPVVLLATGLVHRYLQRTGRIGRPERTAQQVSLSGARRPMAAPADEAALPAGPPPLGPAPPVVWRPAPPLDLEFLLDPLAPAVRHAPAASEPAVATPPIVSPRPVVPPPVIGPPPVIAPIPVPAYGFDRAAVVYAPSGVGGGWTPRPPFSEWRWRPMSPAAATVLRWLAHRTDNPVALYSARRVLPGTLSTDVLVLGVAAVLIGLLIACLMPVAFWLLAVPPLVAPLLFPTLPLADTSSMPYGMAMLIAAMVTFSLLSPMRVCVEVANSFRMERERATLGFLLATPLSSAGIAVGHCVGAVLPAATRWSAAALLALIPATVLAALGYPGAAVWSWGFGFAVSLVYLALCAATGAWIGISEPKARDMTIGTYLLPITICMLGGFSALYLSLTRQWGYGECVAVFLTILVALTVLLCCDTLNELRKMRHGDIPFEGRSVGN